MADRIRFWRRRPTGRARRAAVLFATSVSAAVVTGALVLLVAVVVQPSFTRLEQSAVRLVPPGWDAQPPVEIVPELGAFRRSYQVTFTPRPSIRGPSIRGPSIRGPSIRGPSTDDVEAARVEAVRAALVERADDLGWTSVSMAGDTATFQRSGVRAVVRADAGTVVTSVAPQVGDRQRAAVLGAAVGAGIIAPVALARRWRRRPHVLD